MPINFKTYNCTLQKVVVEHGKSFVVPKTLPTYEIRALRCDSAAGSAASRFLEAEVESQGIGAADSHSIEIFVQVRQEGWLLGTYSARYYIGSISQSRKPSRVS